MTAARVGQPQIEALDPGDVVTALARVLDESEFPPAIRYALSVVLLAQEVRATTEAPFPPRLEHLIGEILAELQQHLPAGTPAAPTPIRRPRP